MRIKKYLWIFALLLILSFSILQEASFAKQPEENISPKPLTKEDIFDELEIFADALTLINANYVDEVSSNDMIYGALEGMLSSLDSHSSFLTPDELNEIQTETRGEFGGIGIKVTMRDKVLTIVSPLEGTPACKAGVKPGDKIIKIDDKSTKDFTLDDVVNKLRGAPGTEVTLTILREGEDKLMNFLIKRAMIKIKSVKPPLVLNDDVGYLRIVEFQQYTSLDLNRAMKALLKKKIKFLILDVRSNPGGLLTSAVSVSEKFLEKDSPIVSTRGRIEQQNMDFKSNALKPYAAFPMAVLINKGSASASEIVAAALRDNKRAVIVGETSFGKGSVQTVIPMKDKSALRLTTSYYYTPSGKVIHEKGLTPDLEVKFISQKHKEEEDGESLEEEKEESDQKVKDYTPEQEKKLTLERLENDNQVQQAIELIKDRERYESLINK
ncbi:MAG: S41 family peptidase [Candidatus Omnitrophota bacterium]